MTETTQEAPVASPIIEINDLNQFVQVLVSWHSQKVATLKHMLEIPDGTEMIVGEGGLTTTLTGDFLAGFKAGIELSLMELGELPFVYETEPDAVPEVASTDV